MHGQFNPESGLRSYVSVEERVGSDHPLCRAKTQADAVLASTSTGC